MARCAVIAPNAMIPPKKHRAALLRLHSESSINFSRRSTDDYVDWVDENFRVCLSQLRAIKACEVTRARAFKKVGPNEIKAIEAVLALMTVNKDFSSKEASDQGELSRSGSDPCLSLVPVVPAAQKTEAGSETAQTAAEEVNLANLGDIFQRVLDKKDSDSSVKSLKKVTGKAPQTSAPSCQAPAGALLPTCWGMVMWMTKRPSTSLKLLRSCRWDKMAAS